MSRIQVIDLKRPHQNNAYRQATKEFLERGKPSGGIILADGVGLGKTYEALATVAASLTHRQHGLYRKKYSPYHVLIIVPRRLFSKWQDELVLPEGFNQYLEHWTSDSSRAIVNTFSNPIILDNLNKLFDYPGIYCRGKIQLPAGLYLSTSHCLFKSDRKVHQLFNTAWDAIIIDEAHHLKGPDYTEALQKLLCNRKTLTLLLTATPFQLSPNELNGLLSCTFGGYGIKSLWRNAIRNADHIYSNPNFKEYRNALNRYFKKGIDEDRCMAISLKTKVEKALRPRLIRNRKKDKRIYNLVDENGIFSPIRGNPFKMNENELYNILNSKKCINLDEETELHYLNIRKWLVERSSASTPTFISNSLRQYLSGYGQFRRTKAGNSIGCPKLPNDENHPKVKALVRLVRNLVINEIENLNKNKCVRKILIFTTYVGGDLDEVGKESQNEISYGTAALLKRILNRELKKIIDIKKSKKNAELIYYELVRTIDKYEHDISYENIRKLKGIIKRFSTKVISQMILTNNGTTKNLRYEKREIHRILKDYKEVYVQINSIDKKNDRTDDFRRQALKDRTDKLMETLKHRYSTRDLVSRYDGAVPLDEKNRHLRGFNTPYSPLILIASSVGQEGIDLQKYCAYVIHYDMEWNPAKLEQREGRVDRQGRKTEGPINIYFLICSGTYDERMLYTMINRFRWHNVLLGNRSRIESIPGEYEESKAPSNIMALALNLTPKKS